MTQELLVEAGTQVPREHTPGPATNPVETLMQMAAGSLLSRSLHIVADLGVADALDDAHPRTAAALAADTGAHPKALERTLRLLSAYGVFELHDDGTLAHTTASLLLRADHPQSMRAFVRMWGLPVIQASYRHFDSAMRTGRPGVELIAPNGIFEYFGGHPDEGRLFGECMTAKARAQVAGVLAAYDFSGFSVIADIGGGRGHLLQAVLDSAPNAKGVLFDLPHVISEVGGLASDRIALQPGDFFRDHLPSCDAYMLMEVIHDWDDERATVILKALRAAAPAGAKLLLIEDIVPDEPGPHWAKTLDVVMLAVTGGLQRTAQQYESLLGVAGFRMERVIQTPTGISIVEAVPE
jgi:O-methyltransferase